MPTRPLPRLLLGLLAVLALAVLLVSTARLRVGDTVLLPGTASGGVRQVSAAAGELSLAVDVRNEGLVPLTVEGPADARLGAYAVRLGRGGPGGGVPEEEVFAPFVLWPGQQRLLVLHLELAAPRAPLDLAGLSVATSVGGVDRVLAVELPEPVQVR